MGIRSIVSPLLSFGSHFTPAVGPTLDALAMKRLEYECISWIISIYVGISLIIDLKYLLETSPPSVTEKYNTTINGLQSAEGMSSDLAISETSLKKFTRADYLRLFIFRGTTTSIQLRGFYSVYLLGLTHMTIITRLALGYMVGCAIKSLSYALCQRALLTQRRVWKIGLKFQDILGIQDQEQYDWTTEVKDSYDVPSIALLVPGYSPMIGSALNAGISRPLRVPPDLIYREMRPDMARYWQVRSGLLVYTKIGVMMKNSGYNVVN